MNANGGEIVMLMLMLTLMLIVIMMVMVMVLVMAMKMLMSTTNTALLCQSHLCRARLVASELIPSRLVRGMSSDLHKITRGFERTSRHRIWRCFNFEEIRNQVLGPAKATPTRPPSDSKVAPR